MYFRLAIALLVAACCLLCRGETTQEHAVLSGRVIDVFRDDVDEGYVYMTLDCNGETSYVATRCEDAQDEIRKLEAYIGCCVTLTGTDFTFDYHSYRLVLKKMFTRNSSDAIIVNANPARDIFDVPDLDEQPPALRDIDRCGLRKVRGAVIARWHDDAILVRTAGGDAVCVQLRDREAPAIGEAVEAVGKVVTDLYRFNLTRAQWRRADAPVPPPAPAEATPLKKILSDGGRRIVNSAYHGREVSVRGKLKGFLSDERGRDRLLVEDGEFQMVVDCSAFPHATDALREGSEVEVTGVCVLESDNWHADVVFPKVSGIFLVPRSANGIRVIRRPPWWTPARLLFIVMGLLAVLAAVLVWNAMLRALVVRKSRALLKEQAMKLSETLKIDERTRLAAELHDFHSQSLTAIAYQVASARNACATDPARAEQILTTAGRMLKSCRTDLRHCLWDLRNDALDEPDFAEAIRQTVSPVAGMAEVAVRFTGSRAQISDTTAHALLSVLRELTANAAVHGQAKNVRIAGEYRAEAIRLSVRDDGCGFDVAARHGQEDGHFGLDGIRERLNRLGGTIDIRSAPGKGTYVRITVNTPREGGEKRWTID